MEVEVEVGGGGLELKWKAEVEVNDTETGKWKPEGVKPRGTSGIARLRESGVLPFRLSCVAGRGIRAANSSAVFIQSGTPIVLVCSPPKVV